MAVYNSKDTEITEDDFMPEQYSYDLDAQKYDYAEGKRQAKAYLFRDAAEFLHFIGTKSDFAGSIKASKRK
jgi:hypothetical protein